MDTLTHAFIGMAIGGAVWAAPVAAKHAARAAANASAAVSGPDTAPGAGAGPAAALDAPATLDAQDVSPFLRRAAIVGAVCAALPDVDIFLRSLGIEHRAWTHAWLTLAIAAPLIALAAKRWLHGRYWRTLVLVALALFSHTFLDCMNGFGTQALLPFSVRMVAWDALPIVDPLFVLPAIVAAVAILASGGARRRGGRVAGRLATAAVVWALFYCGWAMWNSHRAVALVADLRPWPAWAEDELGMVNASTAKDPQATYVYHREGPRVFCRANPQTGTIFLWRVVRRYAGRPIELSHDEGAGRPIELPHYEDATVFYVDTLRGRVLYRHDLSWNERRWALNSVLAAVPQAPGLLAFLLRSGVKDIVTKRAAFISEVSWRRDIDCMLQVEATRERVVLTDLRYGLLTRPEQPLFQMEVELGADGKPKSAPQRWMPRVRVNFMDELAATWRILCGGEMPGGAGAAAPQQ